MCWGFVPPIKYHPEDTLEEEGFPTDLVSKGLYQTKTQGRVYSTV